MRFSLKHEYKLCNIIIMKVKNILLSIIFKKKEEKNSILE